MAVRPPALETATTYADQMGIEAMCFASRQASSDVRGGNDALAKALETDARFRGWLTMSVHQVELSHDLARRYLMRPKWIGARFECQNDDDAIDVGGGYELLNALRRYGKPILLTIGTPYALHAAVVAAREFSTLRFLLSPQNEALTSDALPAMKEALNVALVPVAAFVERDVIAQAVSTLGERGERRVLWASDWGRFHPTAALGMLKDAALTAPQRERISLRNARELLPE